MNDDYLWDGSGEPDAEVQHFEKLLGRYRSVAPMPDFNRVVVMRRRPRWPYAVAAALIIGIALGILRFYTPPNRWRATESDGVAIVPHSILRIGDVVRTERGAVRLQSPAVGTIDVGANTTVRLIENRSKRHRLAQRRERSTPRRRRSRASSSSILLAPAPSTSAASTR